MKGHMIVLAVLAIAAIAALVYFEQSGAHSTRLRLRKIMEESGHIGEFFGSGGAAADGAPEPDADTSAYAAAEYPKDIADNIPTVSSPVGEKRRGMTNGIVLSGRPGAPRARPAPARGTAVPRHAADPTGLQQL